MKHFVWIVALTALCALPSLARVTIELSDPAQGEFLVTYELRASRSHSTNFSFPAQTGLPSRDRPLKVVSITEKNTGQLFDYDLLDFQDEDGEKVEGRYVVNAKFHHPIPDGGYYILEYKLLLYNSVDASQHPDGKWTFRYRTAQDAFFILPEKHSVIYFNYPVRIYGQGGRTILHHKADLDYDLAPIHSELVFKTQETP